MNINSITFLIILSNVGLLFGEVPHSILIFTTTVVLLSFIFKRLTFAFMIKTLLLVASVFLLKHSFVKITQAESAISFVFILAGLKFWELDSENDHFNMFLILALSEAGIYLLNPSFIVFIFGIFKMIFYFYYILTIRQHKLAQINFKRLLFLVTPSILFALIMFYTFPRFTQGFINTNNSAALFSGNRADLNFKDLGPLNLSSNKVFKVYGLNNELKNPESAYWRQMVLWDYHLSEWRSGNLNLAIKEKRFQKRQTTNLSLSYSIETSTTPIDYLPFLDLNLPFFSLPNEDQTYFEFLDNTYKLKSPKRNGISYQITTNPLNDLAMTPLMNKKAIRLKSDKKVDIFNKYFSQNHLKLNHAEKFQLLNKIFAERGFQYSLTPPKYDSLESFILNGELGYCSHFASAYAYLARLIELPSRIVTGFLGGEINPYDDSLIIRELDAHAWVEIYLPEKGWIRVDPTEMVFPDRLRLSNSTIVNSLNPTFFNENLTSLKSVFLWGDAFNSKFDALLFNLDSDRQSSLFSFFFKNKISLGWFFIFVLVSGMGLFYLLPSLFRLSQSTESKAQKRYTAFLKTIKKFGTTKYSHETALQFAERAKKVLPEHKIYIDLETAEYLKMTYENSKKLGK